MNSRASALELNSKRALCAIDSQYSVYTPSEHICTSFKHFLCIEKGHIASCVLQRCAFRCNKFKLKAGEGNAGSCCCLPCQTAPHADVFQICVIVAWRLLFCEYRGSLACCLHRDAACKSSKHPQQKHYNTSRCAPRTLCVVFLYAEAPKMLA